MQVHRFALALVVIGLLSASRSHAADGPKIKWNEIKGDGQVHSRQSGGLGLTLKGGNLWLATFGPQSRVSVTGTAQADYLQKGVTVKFNGEFDKKTGVATAPISEITIYTIRPGERAGLISDDTQSLPGEKRVIGGLGDKTTVSGTVIGAIGNFKDNSIQVGKYKGELTSDVKINVDLADPTLAGQGDSINVKGKWSEIEYGGKKVSNKAGEVDGPGGKKVQKAGVMVVEEMTITLLNPLTAPKKKLPPGLAAKGLPPLGKAPDGEKDIAKDEAKD